MPNLKIAHVRQLGIDVIIVPLDKHFGRKTRQGQQKIVNKIQMCSREADLAGTVVPVWDNGGGRMMFIAPSNWHRFFSSLTLRAV